MRTKYGSKKTELDGRSFASKLEAAVYQILKLREKAGEVSNIECQVQVALSAADIIYKPDFKFTEIGGVVYAEAKGFETPEWRIKRRLWLAYGPAPLEVWHGSAARPALKEILVPRSK